MSKESKHRDLWRHVFASAHDRPDCTAEQVSEIDALTNIAVVFGPHLTPQSAAELGLAVADELF
jgi:hypothetical protein